MLFFDANKAAVALTDALRLGGIISKKINTTTKQNLRLGKKLPRRYLVSENFNLPITYNITRPIMSYIKFYDVRIEIANVRKAGFD